MKGELAVSSFNATTLREVGVAQTTTFRKKTYQECFVAKKILYCIGNSYSTIIIDNHIDTLGNILSSKSKSNSTYLRHG